MVGISNIRPLGNKGQVVIPKCIREQFNLKPGVNPLFEIEDEKIVIHPQYSDTFLNEFCSIVKNKIREPWS
ncbi:MAG: AbrB/MazE/SpoVT family DNA-binding domain-containing protein [Methanospirillaceae archaeon]|nr:AbrB/MazE/SpoVT family DNA-binding domain-containing protein [Methanospirillaceae archaeon]